MNIFLQFSIFFFKAYKNAVPKKEAAPLPFYINPGVPSPFTTFCFTNMLLKVSKKKRFNQNRLKRRCFSRIDLSISAKNAIVNT
jgi:hypothetical protein